MPGESTDERTLGQVLLENLAKAMVENSRIVMEHTKAIHELSAKVEELKAILEGSIEVNADLVGHGVAALRLVDRVAQIAREGGKPTWRHVADVLDEIEREIQEEAAEATEQPPTRGT